MSKLSAELCSAEGVVGRIIKECRPLVEPLWKEWAKEGESPVGENGQIPDSYLSTVGTENPAGIIPDYRERLNTQYHR